MNDTQLSSEAGMRLTQRNSPSVERSRIALVPRKPEDEEFLFRVFASTRAEEVAQTGWPMEQQLQFLRMQFNAQTSAYAMQTPTAEHSIIHVEGAGVGRLIVERTASEIHLVDIALLPDFRNRGIGSLLMSELLAEALMSGRSARLYVERFNPALRWYERMGFVTVSESAIYLEMTWRPSSTGSEAAL